MAFVSGTASTMIGLLTALRDACVANGWTLAGNVLHKGTCYVQLRVLTCPALSTRPAAGVRDYLLVRAGNGIDGSNNLTDPAGNEPCIGQLTNGGTSTTLAYIDWAAPFDYFIHINANPDEVWLAVHFNGTDFMHLGFGQTPGIGNPGTGNWHFATLGNAAATSNQQGAKQFNAIECSAAGVNGSFNVREDIFPLPFWVLELGGNDNPSANTGTMNYVYHGMHGGTEAATWSNAGSGYRGGASNMLAGTGAFAPVAPLLARQPNLWNNEAALLPFQLMILRPDSKSSIQAEMKHMRVLRMDYLDPMTVIDRDPDFWRVYPVYRKNTAVPAGGQNLDHSGCFAVAIRYDGP